MQFASRQILAPCNLHDRRVPILGACILGPSNPRISWRLFLQSIGTPFAKRKCELTPFRITRQKFRKLQHDMSAHSVLGNWNIKKRKLKEKCAQLTVANLQFIEGNEDDLCGRVQKRSSHARKRYNRASDEECDYGL